MTEEDQLLDDCDENLAVADPDQINSQSINLLHGQVANSILANSSKMSLDRQNRFEVKLRKLLKDEGHELNNNQAAFDQFVRAIFGRNHEIKPKMDDNWT